MDSCDIANCPYRGVPKQEIVDFETDTSGVCAGLGPGETFLVLKYQDSPFYSVLLRTIALSCISRNLLRHGFDHTNSIPSQQT
jgi:hypothetical protein